MVVFGDKTLIDFSFLKAKFGIGFTINLINQINSPMNTAIMNNPTLPQFFTNPIKALHRLRDAGFTEQQAEAQIEVFSEHVEANLATKRDLIDLEVKMSTRIKELELKIEIRFKEIEVKLQEMEMKLTIRTGAITSAVVGFFYILEKFF